MRPGWVKMLVQWSTTRNSYSSICAHDCRGAHSLLMACRCFYLDSPSNARMHGMAVKSKHEADISEK